MPCYLLMYLYICSNVVKIITSPGIVKALLQNGKKVYIPKVDGPAPSDMRMLRVDTLKSLLTFEKNKWNIFEPSEKQADQMEDALAPNASKVLT